MGFRTDVKLYNVAGPYLDMEVVEHEISATLNVSTTEPTLVLDSLVRNKPVLGGGVDMTLFGKKLVDLGVKTEELALAFEYHTAPLPVTIPLTGIVTPTIH